MSFPVSEREKESKSIEKKGLKNIILYRYRKRKWASLTWVGFGGWTPQTTWHNM